MATGERPEPRSALWLGAFLGMALVLGAVVRAGGLAAMPLWIDELHTLDFARLDLGRLLRTESTLHPPAYALLARFALSMGDAEWLVRLPALVGGLAGIVVAFGLLRETGHRAAAVLGAFATALSVYHVYFSQEARGYSWMAALSGATVWFAIRHLHRPSASNLALALASAVVAPLFHYLAAPTSVAMVLVLLGADARRWVRRGPPGDGPRAAEAIPWAGLLLVTVAVALTLAPRLATVFGQVPATTLTSLAVGPRFIAEHWGRWLGLGTTGGLAAGLLGVAGLVAVTRRMPRAGLALAVGVVAPLLTLACLPWNRFYEARYAMAALLPALALSVAGLAAVGNAVTTLLGGSPAIRRGVALLLGAALLGFQTTATAHHFAAPSKFHPALLASRFEFEHLVLKSLTSPHLMREHADTDFTTAPTRVGPLLLPMPAWDPTDVNVLAVHDRRFIRPGQWHPPQTELNTITYFMNTESDDTLEVLLTRVPFPDGAAPAVSRLRAAPAYARRAVATQLAEGGQPGERVTFHHRATGERIGFTQLSWSCSQWGMQVTVSVRSARLEATDRFLDGLVAQAGCTR